MERGVPMLASEPGELPEVYYTVADGSYTAPPCRSGELCPKGCPENEELYTLHPVAEAIYGRWKILRSTFFQALTEEEKNDDFLLQCYEICADLTERADAVDDTRRQFNTLVHALYPKKQ